MNPEENAIIIFDKNRDKSVDKCDQIKSIDDTDCDKTNVTYNNNVTYRFNKENVLWLTKPEK
ncbi:MAG: hypothetical protein LBU04_00155 [Christensenellaceae bacterium]|jgi:hypothetical protein|nr:hypothetical protein [Christensenellaceae bacterium]